MNHKVLVTYASRTGSTSGVAEAIGRKLSENYLDVDVVEMKNVVNLESYSAVIAGSAIQGGEWLPEANEFMQKNVQSLQQKPFAAFLVCMTLAMKQGEKYRPHVANMLSPIRSLVQPISTGLFAGSLQLDRLTLANRVKFGISILLGIWKKGDHRDWKAIDAWAEELGGLLKERIN